MFHGSAQELGWCFEESASLANPNIGASRRIIQLIPEKKMRLRGEIQGSRLGLILTHEDDARKEYVAVEGG